MIKKLIKLLLVSGLLLLPVGCTKKTQSDVSTSKDDGLDVTEEYNVDLEEGQEAAGS